MAGSEPPEEQSKPWSPSSPVQGGRWLCCSLCPGADSCPSPRGLTSARFTQGMVEKWLQQVEQMMLASMREVIRLGIEAYVEVKGDGNRPGCWYSSKDFGEKVSVYGIDWGDSG